MPKPPPRRDEEGVGTAVGLALGLAVILAAVIVGLVVRGLLNASG